MKNAKKLNRQKGIFFELLACFILILKGYKILKWNFKRKNTSQLDIIAQKKDALIIVEVKYRKKIEDCLFAIHPQQQKRIKMSAINIEKKYNTKAYIDGIFFAKEKPFCKHIKNIF